MIKIQSISIPESAIPTLNPAVLRSVVADVAASARNHWIKLAEKDSSVFRFDYIQGIQPVVNEKGTEHSISLVGAVPHILEDGSPRLDLRDILLGPNVPVAPMGKKGKRVSLNGHFYRAIPFRHVGPNAKGKTIGQAMGSAYGGNAAVLDAKKLGRAVYKAAKQLTATTTTPYGGKTSWGGRLSTLGIIKGLKPGIKGIPLMRAHHKSSIYEGMVRQEKTYEKATQSHYTTFRTISTGVRDESWWRKEIRARHYAITVERFISKLLPKAIDALIEAQ
jgi:hypothetical protein